MNVAMNTYRKRIGPIRPVFANPYGMGRLGAMQCDIDMGAPPDPTTGLCSDGSSPVDVITPTGPAPTGWVGGTVIPTSSPIGTSLSTYVDTTGASCDPSLVQTSGNNVGLCPGSNLNDVLWTDVNGQLCTLGTLDDNSLCPSSPGYQAASAGSPPAATTSAAQGSSAAKLAAAITGAARGATPGAATSIQCGNGVAVPAGQKCPSTTPGIFGCPTGSTNVNGMCVPGAAVPAGQWFASVSNTQVILLAGGTIALVVLVSSLSGGGGRRRR